MALYDENGKITIDENAAQKDVESLKKILVNLEAITVGISQIEMQATEFDSSIGNSILENCSKIKSKLKIITTTSNETVDIIAKTVQKYQTIDRKLKDTINTLNIFGGE